MNGINKPPQELHDPWVVHKSKSRPGIKYYFNTVTGESVWDLNELSNVKPIASASAIEKNTKPITARDVPGVTSGVPTVINEQVVAKSSYNEMFPQSNPGGSGFPSNIWTNPPNLVAGNVGMIPATLPGEYIIVQRTLVPAATPLIAQPNTNYGIHQQNDYYPSNQTLPTRFRNNNTKRGHKKKGGGVIRQNQSSHNRPNLRARLLSNRRKSANNIDYNNWEDTNSKDNNKLNNNWNNFLEESPSKYDLSKLKHLNSNPKQVNWFVVVDIDILVNEFQFLDKFTSPEQNCYLVVPLHVMDELQVRAAGLDRNVKRIHRFLTEKINYQHAFKGEDVSERAEDDCDKTFATCLDWAEQDNVILLSNDAGFIRYRGASKNVHVLTMRDLKHILSQSTRPSARQEMPTGNSVSDIKIIVPNNKTADELNVETPSYLPPEKPNDTIIKETIHVPFKAPEAAKTSQSLNDNAVMKPSDIIISIRQNGSDTTAQKTAPNEMAVTNPQLNSQATVSTNTAQATSGSNKKIKLRRWHRHKKPTNGNTEEKVATQEKTDTVETPDPMEITSVPCQREEIISASLQKEEKVSPEDNSTSVLCQKEGMISEPCQKESVTSAHCEEKGLISEKKEITVSVTGQKDPVTNHDESSRSSTKSNSTHSTKRRLKMRTAVMYEVNDETMEEVLRSRRDEWVIRFVQIMEEVLRLKLLGNSGLHLHEAVKCVIQKYSNEFNVVDAANKLSYILYQISDNTGNIKSDIDPEEYMDMYSYGVYLIETLKDVSDNCEDLIAAHESLIKLLSDIKNTNLDVSQESFIESDFHEEIAPMSMVEPEQNSQPNSSKEIIEDHDPSRRSFASELSIRTFENPQENEPQDKVALVASSFLSNLRLRKKFQDTKLLESRSLSDNDDSNEPRPLTPKSPSTSPRHQTMDVEKESEMIIENEDQNTGVVRVTRNFVAIPENETKFQSTCKGEDEMCKQESRDSVERAFEVPKEDGEMQSDETKIRDANFRSFIQIFLVEVRTVLQNVIMMCSSSGKESVNKQGEYCLSRIAVDKMEKAANLLAELSNALTNILERNNNPALKKTLWQELKDANLNEYIPSEALVAEYSNTIKGLKLQVDNLRKAVNLIIEKQKG